MNRPRVTARHYIEPRVIQGSLRRSNLTTPYVLVEIEFDADDAKSALAFLESAVRDVRAQIEEARGDVIERNRAAFEEEVREAHTIARRKESQ